ncbi:MAG: hypothetical protein ACKVOX_01965 [Rhizobacter sp.]
MSTATLPPMRVPTLTEIVEWTPSMLTGAPEPRAADADPAPELPEAALAPDITRPEVEACIEHAVEFVAGAEAEALLAAPPMIDESALAHRIVSDLQKQVDPMLEDRLRTALTPMLERLMQSLLQEARDELALTLRDVVAAAVSRELEQHRGASDRSEPV